MTRNPLRSWYAFGYIFLLVIIASGFTYADTLYVSLGGNALVMQFDSSGNGDSLGSPWYATGLACDNSGNLYAALIDGTIMKSDSSGHASVFASLGENPNFFPYGITADSSGNLYVAVRNGTIRKFDSSGHESVFASGFDSAWGLTSDPHGNLYVGLTGNGMIYKLDSSGTVVSSISVWNAFSAFPYGLACDSEGVLYAALNNGTIMTFDSGGQGSVFSSGFGPLQGIAFDNRGNLFAADPTNRRVVALDPLGNSSVFATDLNVPWFIAVQVPEPCTFLLLGIGGLLIRKRTF